MGPRAKLAKGSVNFEVQLGHTKSVGAIYNL